MVSPVSLCVFAATLLCLAIAVAWLRRTKVRTALAEGGASLGGASLLLTASAALFALARPLEASELSQDAALLALMASPLGATLGLRWRGRRSIPRALLASAVALAGVVLWLTLFLRGPRGGWTFRDAALVVTAAAIAVASAACLGWWSKRLAISIALCLLVSASGCKQGSAARNQVGTLELTILDATTGAPTAARLELLDEHGDAVIPEDALTVFSDCGNLPVHAWVPGFASVQALKNGHRAVQNPYTGTQQFYADGSTRLRLAPGIYSVLATKGIEYKQARGMILIEAGQSRPFDLTLERWVDLAGEGWYSADDHLHIPRPHPRFDPRWRHGWRPRTCMSPICCRWVWRGTYTSRPNTDSGRAPSTSEATPCSSRAKRIREPTSLVTRSCSAPDSSSISLQNTCSTTAFGRSDTSRERSTATPTGDLAERRKGSHSGDTRRSSISSKS